MNEFLTELIKNGEDSFHEFKSDKVHPDSLAKEMVAFANSMGGQIYMGVEDNGNITGINRKEWEEKIIQISRNSIEPSLIPSLAVHNYNEMFILEIKIEKGKYKPYKVKSSNKYYIRVGSVSIEPTKEELVRLFQDGELYHFEVKSIPGTSSIDLNWNLFFDYCAHYRNFSKTDEVTESILKNLQFSSEDGFTTVAGLLCFGKNPSRYLPQSGIALHRFAGEDVVSEVLENRELEGTIPFLIDAAQNFIKSHISVKSTIPEDGNRRVDVFQYDTLVFKELIVNAFQHRDWSIFGQKIRIQIFNNRIEIFSPGKIPNTLTLKNILYGNSYYRNPLLSQVVRDYGYSDKMGRGLQKVFSRCAELNVTAPEIFADTNSFIVKVYSSF